jgi:DNA mismatch endonuclease (patch repair protein)
MISRRRQSPEKSLIDPVRSRIMSLVRQANTAPELIVRRTLHDLGLRFRLHRKDIAGTPDIVLPKHRTVIFVHGCFWHRHIGCSKTTTPKIRAEFWHEKFDRNVDRDARNERVLIDQGWNVLIVWECETKNLAGLRQRLSAEFFSLGP